MIPPMISQFLRELWESVTISEGSGMGHQRVGYQGGLVVAIPCLGSSGAEDANSE